MVCWRHPSLPSRMPSARAMRCAQLRLPFRRRRSSSTRGASPAPLPSQQSPPPALPRRLLLLPPPPRSSPRLCTRWPWRAAPPSTSSCPPWTSWAAGRLQRPRCLRGDGNGGGGSCARVALVRGAAPCRGWGGGWGGARGCCCSLRCGRCGSCGSRAARSRGLCSAAPRPRTRSGCALAARGCFGWCRARFFRSGAGCAPAAGWASRHERRVCDVDPPAPSRPARYRGLTPSPLARRPLDKQPAAAGSAVRACFCLCTRAARGWKHVGGERRRSSSSHARVGCGWRARGGVCRPWCCRGL